MKANGVQLTHFGFPADAYEGDDPIEEMFEGIQASQSVSTISFLEISCRYEIDALILSRNLIDFYLNLNYLTSLDAACGSDDDLF